MKHFLAIITFFVSSTVFAQTSKQALPGHKQVVVSKLEASVDSKGEMIFRGKDMVTGKTVMLSAEDGFEALKILAKVACAAAPSSVTVSAGVVSVTWEKEELCK